MSTERNPGAGESHAQARLLALDVLRGFDMLWLIGGASFFRQLSAAAPSPLTDFLAGQLTHSPWEGLTFYDLVFPLFLFIMGASLVFSIDRSLQTVGRTQTFKKIVKRSLLLFVLGTIVDAADGDWNVLMGVLQRIALCYLAAALCYIYLSRRALFAVCAAILVLYWLLLAFVPLPGESSVSFAKHHNWPNAVDSRVINFFSPPSEQRPRSDPEGILSTFPAICSTLLGIFGAMALRLSPFRRRVSILAVAGLAMLFFGLLWGQHFPIVKRLWTSTYVLATGGMSFLLLAAVHTVADVWCKKGWAAPFLWIGSNALAVYVLANIVNFPARARSLHTLLRLPIPETTTLLAASALELSAAVGLCFLLYRKKIFLRL